MTSPAPDTTTSVSPTFNADYADRVYAGVLGKIIGVYVGRPFEQWTYEAIRDRLGNIRSYVHDELGEPLIVTDDDITGTFTFIRAVLDSGKGYDTTSDDIAEAWLNYLIEERSVLWWGGLGNSTEHTAYLRLKQGHRPPYSGSAELNTQVVAEQIGAQIFIEGWALIAPGAPALAAELAGRAARVSHDGEAVYGAQAMAAMESAAFNPISIQGLIDVALATVPADSVVARVITDVRNWHASESDWRVARDLLQEHYGYDIYGGNCHMVPNHGLIILALLYGNGDFTRSMEIVNTAGWDTDCNAGNLGALLGIWGGIESLDAGPDWRGPVSDRVYLPSADSGNGISDALREAGKIVEAGYASAGIPFTAPKGGARFHFSAPGSTQGFVLDRPESGSLSNQINGTERALRIRSVGNRAVATTPTFLPSDAFDMKYYPLDVSPSLYSGQNIETRLSAAAGTSQVAQLVLRVYDAGDRLTEVYSPEYVIDEAGTTIEWEVPDTEGQPIQSVGVVLRSELAIDAYLDYLTWTGSPSVTFERPVVPGTAWRRAWARATDYEHIDPEESFRLVQNSDTRGLLLTGTQDWRDYSVEARITPHAAAAVGVIARARGLRRYLALRWTRDGGLAIIRHVAGEDIVLAQAELPWTGTQILRLQVAGSTVTAYVDDRQVLAADDTESDQSGAIGLLIENGRAGADYLKVAPVVN